MYNQYNPYTTWNMNQNMEFSNTKFSKMQKINWSGILNNTQKTLGIINQAIPIVYQVRPLFNNARTLFKIAGAINEETPKKSTRTNEENNQNDNEQQEYQKEKSNLQFFL